jgi:Domain of unknown function DUF11
MSKALDKALRITLLAILLSLIVGSSRAQDIPATELAPPEPEAPKVDLLKLNGSKPNLSPDGEGIISIKISDLFQRGVTNTRLFEPDFKIELPAGYTLFNRLVYQIDSKAVFSGPNDYVFRVPSATSKESFRRLRILYPERDSVDPQKLRWIDATLEPHLISTWKHYLTKTDFDKRLPDFKTRTLHGFIEERPEILVVASKDSGVSRDNFSADLSLTGTFTEQVMVGRPVIYDLTLTNLGPDTATDISFHADNTFHVLSVNASQEKCRTDGAHVYCKFASLEKGKSISIKIEERCDWDTYNPNSPVVDQGETKNVEVKSPEGEPNPDNNYLTLTTRVIDDQNQAPVAEIVSPKQDELFVGPNATVTIIARASDPDGFVNEIEFFDQGRRVGKGVLTTKDEYQLVYKDVALGRHWLSAKATDNLGRVTQVSYADFFVNGLAQVGITEPKADSLLDRQDEISVTVRASHPKLGIKEVKVYLTVIMGGYGQADAVAIGNDQYVAKINCSFCKRKIELMAVAIDDDGAETRAAPASYTLRQPPEVLVHGYDGGEDLRDLVANQINDFPPGSTFLAGADVTRDTHHENGVPCQR